MRRTWHDRSEGLATYRLAWNPSFTHAVGIRCCYHGWLFDAAENASISLL